MWIRLHVVFVAAAEATALATAKTLVSSGAVGEPLSQTTIPPCVDGACLLELHKGNRSKVVMVPKNSLGQCSG
jgi:hypothetical protein